MLTSNQGDETKEKNLVPVIERMLDILEILERSAAGVGIRQLCQDLSMPRSTVYRILNTLEVRDMVRRTSNGSFMLGSRLLMLAANVFSGETATLVDIGKQRLEALSRATGEASKLSVCDVEKVLVIAVATGSGEYSLSVKPGQKQALHAGAASKVLLAHMPPHEIDRLLSAPLMRYTEQTLVDPVLIREELETIRRQGWAYDQGEFSNGVFAVAAPVKDRNGKVVAAASIPFLSTPDAPRVNKLRLAVIAAVAAIAEELANAA